MNAKGEDAWADNGLVGDSILVSGRGIEHAGCRYMAALFAGVEDPDQRIWFCNKCGHGGVLDVTQAAIAEVLHLTAVRLRDDVSGTT